MVFMMRVSSLWLACFLMVFKPCSGTTEFFTSPPVGTLLGVKGVLIGPPPALAEIQVEMGAESNAQRSFHPTSSVVKRPGLTDKTAKCTYA